MTASKKRPGSLHAGDLDWQPAEWANEDQNSLVVYEHGYELIVTEETEGAWSWMVKATNEISETPEVIDAGEARSRGNAKVKACAVVNRLPKSKKVTPETPEPVAKKTVAKKTAAKKTAAKPKKAAAPAASQKVSA